MPTQKQDASTPVNVRSKATKAQPTDAANASKSTWSSQSVAGSTILKEAAQEPVNRTSKKSDKSDYTLGRWLAETPTERPWNGLASSRR